jgi:hypothetical protein
VKKIIRRFPLCVFLSYERDAKHPMLIQGVLQHLLVAGLENVEWQQRVRKKQRAR